jgi:hypothetical protein
MPGIRLLGLKKLKARLATTALVVSGGLLLLPATSQAAQVFGSGLFNQPNQPNCEMGPCTIAAFAELPAEGQVVNGGAPIDGVITKFKIRAKVENPNTQVTFRVVNVTPDASPVSATATGAGTGPTVTLQTTGADGFPIQEFPARLPVKKGQHLGINGPANLIATHSTSDAKLSYEFAPPLVDGAPARPSNAFLGELLVQGTMEPDADGDGFGDETQDACPAQASTQGACDLTKPAFANLRVRKGKISYMLSEASTVKFRLEKKKAGGKFKALGRAFSGPGNAGANRRGLPRAGKLGPGVYRLSGTATDLVGNSGTGNAVFRIKARR